MSPRPLTCEGMTQLLAMCLLGLARDVGLVYTQTHMAPSGEAHPSVFYSDKFLCQRWLSETGQIGFRVGRVLHARATNTI